MKIEMTDSRCQEDRKNCVKQINTYFNDAVSWYELILKKCGVPEETVNKTVESVLGNLDTRKKRADFVNRTVTNVASLFNIPTHTMNEDLFSGLTHLAFSEKPPPVESLPDGISRVALVECVIRTANGSPEDIGLQMLDRLSTSLGYQSQPKGAGTGVDWQCSESVFSNRNIEHTKLP